MARYCQYTTCFVKIVVTCFIWELRRGHTENSGGSAGPLLLCIAGGDAESMASEGDEGIEYSQRGPQLLLLRLMYMWTIGHCPQTQ